MCVSCFLGRRFLSLHKLNCEVPLSIVSSSELKIKSQYCLYDTCRISGLLGDYGNNIGFHLFFKTGKCFKVVFT